jgi:hypothetical protein
MKINDQVRIKAGTSFDNCKWFPKDRLGIIRAFFKNGKVSVQVKINSYRQKVIHIDKDLLEQI